MSSLLEDLKLARESARPKQVVASWLLSQDHQVTIDISDWVGDGLSLVDLLGVLQKHGAPFQISALREYVRKYVRKSE